MKRLAHKLAPNRATTRPERMIFFDTETIPHHHASGDTEQEFRLGVACYWRKRRDDRSDTVEWLEFTRVGEFWDWALRKATSHALLHLVAHNLAFDAQVCQTFLELPERGWRLIFLYENGHTRLLSWGWPTPEFSAWIETGQPLDEYEGHRWTTTLLMMDNANLFPGSVESWGKSLGFPKLKRPPYKADNTEWWPYCKRDVEIMVRLWEEWFPFLDEHQLGTFRATIGSQAFGGFRHGYMHNRIEIHDDEEAIALERAAYLGGRTEAFYVGRVEGRELYKLDVNSMYPYVMHTFQYPTRLKARGTAIPIPQLAKLVDKGGVIAEVTVEIDAPVYPLKEEGKNVYPVGELRTTLTTPELLFALKRGWVREVHAFATYATRRLFYWYVTYFYDLKRSYERDGDRLRRQLVKLLLNSLYGKFGQAGYEDRLIGTCDPERLEVQYGMDAPSRQRFTIYVAGGSMIKQVRTGEGYNSFVGIAAHVTAYARMYLWLLIEQAGRHNVYYVDTDSLIVNQAGYDALANRIDPDRLGYLKVEETATSLEIRAPKDYDFGEHTVRKGVPLSASLLDRNTFKMETWPSMRSHLADGITDTFHNRDVTKTLTYAVDWGELQTDGWVTPYYRGLRPLLF
jgi:hypothetical protein